MALLNDLFSLNAFYVEVTELKSMDAFTPPAYSLPHENKTHKENIITRLYYKSLITTYPGFHNLHKHYFHFS